LKKSQRAEFQCLIAEDGQGPEWLELAGLTSLGGRWMPNIGESPNVEKESFLWQILEADAPPKYSLSPKACLGILKRAQKRKRDQFKGGRVEMYRASWGVAVDRETPPTG
jgi:hypothetical protein